MKYPLTYGYKRCIIIKACKQSDEVECGYILRELRNGGNFYGVCHGLDQAVSFIKLKALIPRLFMQSLGFIMGIKETPGCV